MTREEFTQEMEKVAKHLIFDICCDEISISEQLEIAKNLDEIFSIVRKKIPKTS